MHGAVVCNRGSKCTFQGHRQDLHRRLELRLESFKALVNNLIFTKRLRTHLPVDWLASAINIVGIIVKNTHNIERFLSLCPILTISSGGRRT